jgi:site-specific recombinase XerD
VNAHAKRPYYGGGRRGTGSLERRSDTYIVRFLEGEKRTPYRLETLDPVTAERRQAALGSVPAEARSAIVATWLPPTVEPIADLGAGALSFFRAAERAQAQRIRDGVVSAADGWSRLKRWVFPTLGRRDVNEIKTREIDRVLDKVRDAGKAKDTVDHVLNDIRAVFRFLQRNGEIESNPATGATMPRFPRRVRKERAVLTDGELLIYLAWVHPDEEQREHVLERQVMACLARMFGGLRTGDLHALRWDAFAPGGSIASVGFEWGWAPRQKTRRPQKLVVPEVARGALFTWWITHDKPTEGLIFPARRGARAGEEKRKVSHAAAFREDLRRAFGIVRPVTRVITRSNGRKMTKSEWEPARAMTPRERELLEPGAYTMPVDWHSWRRAYTQALADAGATAQQATALAGHASLSAHARYLQRSGRALEAPAGSVPVWNGADFGHARGDDDEDEQLPDPPADVPAIANPSKKKSGRKTSGADGTRTRGLRRDRPAL